MYLTVNNLNLSFENKKLYSDASFRILPGDKIGVVGSNGVGKTTLINVLCGNLIPDSGEIKFDDKINVGYLDQYMNIDKNLTIKEYLNTAFLKLYKIEEELNILIERMKQTTEENLQLKLATRITSLRDELEKHEFYQINTKIMKISSGLGITNYGMDKLLKHLSGGQKIKVILAKLLLEQPDLLILDEPTNFLDTVHVDWLVKFLKEYKGTFLIVSHNQEFLNDVVNVILEIEYQKITRYKGNYEAYLAKKAIMAEQLEKAYLKQQKEIGKLEEYIAKNKVRTATAKQAKSREKKLEKIEKIEIQKSSDVYINLSFNYIPISSHKFLEVKDLEIGYYGYSLLPKMNFTIKSGEKLGVTGFNGIGKSTLMKTLVGELPVVAGEFKFVDNAQIAYFSQEHTWEDDNLTPLQEISNLYPKMEEKEIRSYLARSGLRGTLAIQPIKTLSGGEQAKLKLCKMMLKKANILIFDEPTNHLDANAKEGLVKALKNYPGTVIIVTHEQSFLKEVVTSVYDFEELLLS